MANTKKYAQTPQIVGNRYNAAVEHRENVIGRHIAAARKQKGLTLAEFSTRLADYGLDITRYALAKWESGDSAPNAYQLLAVCEALEIPDGFHYFMDRHALLLNAEGLRKLAEYQMDLIASGRYQPKQTGAIRYIEMPVSSLSASAGTGEFLEEGSFEMVRVPETSVPAGAEFGVRVHGDSMEPVYRDGQIAWVQSCRTLRPGEVGIFLYDGEGYIKAYGEQEPADELREAYTDSSGVLRMQPVLISYNEAYAPKAVSPELGFSVVGRVLN